MPDFATREWRDRKRYPREIRLKGTAARLRYRLSKPEPVGDYDDCVIRRSLFAWLSDGKRHIGAFEMHEFDPNGCGTNDDFTMVMDADEEIEAKLSEALAAEWDDVMTKVTYAGPILEFRYAWIAPQFADGKLFALASNALIKQFSPAHSILVMKGFPIEYEGKVPNGSRLRKAVKRRQAAMKRYYARVFGVRPLRGQYGKKGWLWATNPKNRDDFGMSHGGALR